MGEEYCSAGKHWCWALRRDTQDTVASLNCNWQNWLDYLVEIGIFRNDSMNTAKNKIIGIA